MRILYIEDNQMLIERMEEILEKKYYTTTCASTAEEGIEYAKLGGHNLILLDLTLPDMDGIDVIRELRNSHISIPIIVLSGRAQIEDKLSAFKQGADDFIVKPFHKDELTTRISTLLRRCEGIGQSIIRLGELEIDIENKNVNNKTGPVPLTRKEYEVLELMSMRKGRPVSKSSLMTYLYGGSEKEPEMKIIDVFACTLRKKLAKANNGINCIETLWGRGYMLNDNI